MLASTDAMANTTSSHRSSCSLRLGIMFILFMALLSTFTSRSGNGPMVLAQQTGEETGEDGYCSYSTRVRYTATVTVSLSKMMRTTVGCGWFFDWSRCTSYRTVYEMGTTSQIKYRIAAEVRCCVGWEMTSPLTGNSRLVCTKLQVLTTAPLDENVTGINNIQPTRAENIVNYTLNGVITNMGIGIDVTTLPPDVDGVPEVVSRDPLTDTVDRERGLFTGDRGMIGLIVIILAFVVVVSLVTVIIVCCYRRKKLRRKVSDPTSGQELELLNRSATPSTGRVGESAYAEIPEGQQNGSTCQLEGSSTLANSHNNVVSTNEGARPVKGGGNQYHEIADVLQAGAAARLPPPEPPKAHKTNDGVDNNYAYAYVDRQILSTRQAGVEVTNKTQAVPDVDLKGASPTAEYAEVHKKKAGRPNDSVTTTNLDALSDDDALPTTIQSYTTVILPEDSEENQPNTGNGVVGNPEPYDEVVIGTRIPQTDSAVNDNPEPYGEVEFGTGIPRKDTVKPDKRNVEIGNNVPRQTTVKHDNPEPYSDIEIGVGLPLEDHYNNPEPYGEIGVSAGVSLHEGYDHVHRNDSKSEYAVADDANDAPKPYGELGLRPAAKENTEYDRMPRSTTPQDGVASHNESPNAGYGVILNQGDGSLIQNPANNTYSTLEKIKAGAKQNAENRQPSPDVYDRLDRQISTTSSTSEPHAKMRDEQQGQEVEKSQTYSKMKRSNSREDTIKATHHSPAGYGVLGDTTPEVYDRLDAAGGGQLSAKIPVQEYKGYGRIGAVNDTGLHPVNDYDTLNKSGNPPEGPYATIPEDMKQSGETYDKLHRMDNHEASSENQTGPSTATSTQSPSPSVPHVSTVDSHSSRVNHQDILYENTPKGNQDITRESIDLKQGKIRRPLVTTIYDTPVSRVNSLDETSEGEPSSARSSNYDTPSSRISSLGTCQEDPGKDSTTSAINNYDSPKSRSMATRPSIDQSGVDGARPAEKYEDMEQRSSRISNASTGSYYEDMNRESRISRGSLDFSIPVGTTAPSFSRQDTLYENRGLDNDS